MEAFPEQVSQINMDFMMFVHHTNFVCIYIHILKICLCVYIHIMYNHSKGDFMFKANNIISS